jgi:hypothetical protein
MLDSWHEPAAAESTLRLDRRALLCASGAAALAAASASAQARALAGTDPLLLTGALVVLQDRRLVLPEDVKLRLTGDGMRLLMLEADPVRMWRGEHAAVLANPATRLLGVTPWIEFVMIQGLAAESRRRVRYQRFDRDNDAMVWLIA